MAGFYDATAHRPVRSEGEADPTAGFGLRFGAERAAEVERTREAFAARLETGPDSDPPHWPIEMDGKRLPHGVAIEAQDLLRFSPDAPRGGTALERFSRAVAVALAAREEHHRRWLSAAPGWAPWPPHKPKPWDAAMRRRGLVAPLVLEREAVAPPPDAPRRAS